jgi:hypothetical protein
LPEVKTVLGLIKEFDLVLCTGHLSKEEVVGLFDEAKRMGVRKFIVTHPLKVAGTSLDLATQKTLAEKGAFVEHCFVATLSRSGVIDPFKIVEAVRFVGVERCLLSTDLGRLEYPPPWEGIQRMVRTLLERSLSKKDLTILMKENPCRLLDLQ